MKTASINDIALALDKHKSTVGRRAKKEGWKHTFNTAQGGVEKLFIVKHLPHKVRMALARHLAGSALTGNTPTALAGAAAGQTLAQDKNEASEKAQIAAERQLALFAELPPARQAVAWARKDVLTARDNYLAAAAIGNIKQGTGEFCRLYNSGEIRIDDHIKTHVKKVSWSSLSRWQATLKQKGLVGLAPGYHNPRKGTTTLTPEQVDLVLGMLVKKPHCSFNTLALALEARFEHPPGQSALRRYVKTWRRENESLIEYIINPDKWRNKRMFAVGDASEQVERLNQLWEFDSTPADVMLADGRYCLIGVIDVYSRRLKLLVSKTSRSTAVAALTRRALLDWGVPEAVKTDNGADYVSYHMIQVFEDLRIEQILCPPFTPQCKPHIERVFKTFAHSFQELMPGYIGHSVADRKDIETRRSFADRIMSRDNEVEILMTAEELQLHCDRWCRAMYHQDKHRHLNGKTPDQMARNWTAPLRTISNERALDILMAESVSGGGRTVTKKGVSVDNITYIADNLPEVGTRVLVKKDLTDLGSIYLFASSGEFLCVAQDPLRTGVDRVEIASKLHARQQKYVKEGQKELKKIARQQALDDIHEEILNHRESQLDNIIPLPPRTEDYTTPALDAAAQAAEAFTTLDSDNTDPDIITLSGNEIDLSQVRQEAQAPRRKSSKVTLLRSDADTYDQLSSAIKNENRRLTQQEYDWLTTFYETTMSGKAYLSIEGDLRQKVGLVDTRQQEA